MAQQGVSVVCWARENGLSEKIFSHCPSIQGVFQATDRQDLASFLQAGPQPAEAESQLYLLTMVLFTKETLDIVITASSCPFDSGSCLYRQLEARTPGPPHKLWIVAKGTDTGTLSQVMRA